MRCVCVCVVSLSHSVAPYSGEDVSLSEVPVELHTKQRLPVFLLHTNTRPRSRAYCSVH